MRSIFVATAAAAALLVGMPASGAPSTASNLPAVEIANTKFVLKNGLTLIVHEDHKAPIVAVNFGIMLAQRMSLQAGQASLTFLNI